MRISHKHKFVFIAIPKTASVTIRTLLNQYSDSDMRYVVLNNENPHITAEDVKKELFANDTKKFNSYFKFAYVRNPWPRLLSEFLYRKKRIGVFEGSVDKPEYIVHSEKMFNEVGTFSGWVKSKYINTDAPNFPVQYKHIFDKNGNQLVDFIGRFENLQEDFNTICDKIGIPRQELPHKNKTKHKHYTEYYDDETREIVAEVYKDDIETFGYEFDG